MTPKIPQIMEGLEGHWYVEAYFVRILYLSGSSAGDSIDTASAVGHPGELHANCTQLLPACLLEITRLGKAELAHIEMPAQGGQNLIGGQGLDLFLQVDVEGHRPIRMKLQP